MARTTVIIYIILGVVHLLLLALHLPGHHITKCLLMPALVGVVLASRKRGKHTQVFTTLLVVSILFSWTGDIFLMGQQPEFFLAGLGAFAVAHIFYIVLLAQKIDHTWKKRWIRLIPLLLYVAALMYFVVPAIMGNETQKDFLGPVIFYSCILLAMGTTALLRNTSCAWVWSGALLFIISDSLIAWNMFVGSIPAASILIMLTYISAQLLLVKGLLYTA